MQMIQPSMATVVAFAVIVVVLLVGALVSGWLQLRFQHLKRQLQESETRYRTMFESMNEGIIVIDEEGTIEAVNPSAEALFGYPAEAMRGQDVRLLMPEPDASRHHGHVATYVRTGIKHIIGTGREIQARHRDGSVFPTELHVNEIWIDGRRRFVGMFQNIAERLKARQHRKEAAEQAERAMRARADFLASMSHEIRTPLNGMLGMLELLAQQQLDADARKYASLARESAVTLLAIINDILDLSKIEAGRVELRREAIDVRELAEHCTAVAAGRTEPGALEVGANVAPDVPRHVGGDGGRLRQVLANLLDNAVKFTESGSVTLRIDRQSDGDGRVTLRFEVRDTGAGIPADCLATLFEPFVQLAGNGHELGGSGLGLSISRQLVRMMGGDIHVDSAPGEGSTFWFTAEFASDVPAEAADGADEHGAPADAGDRADGSRRVLLVEDNAINRRVCEEMLSRLGVRVDTVLDGAQAVEAVASAYYDLVLMDCQMPEMDGYTATGLIRQRETRHSLERVPIVAMTAHAMEGDREACLAAGMDDYLSKPFRFADLQGVVQRWLTSQK